MKIINIIREKMVEKTEQELEEEYKNCRNDVSKFFINKCKMIPTEEPTYIVEMSAKEIQLVSFYLELENRKPIVNVELKAELKKEKLL